MKKYLTCLFLALGLLVTPAIADSPYDYPRAETVKLSTETGVGSGVVLEPGIVLTAAHVAENEGLVSSRKEGLVGDILFLEDAIVRNNNQVDLALLWYREGVHCPCVKLAEYEAEVDEPVIVVGFPSGIAQVVTEGKSQGVQQEIRTYVSNGFFSMELFLGKRLVLTAPVSGGNSGGGVFVKRNNEWQLVGILVEGVANLAFAVPLETIKQFIKKAQIQ
jgi:S1-C subfamily serine protease